MEVFDEIRDDWGTYYWGCHYCGVCGVLYLLSSGQEEGEGENEASDGVSGEK